MSGIEATGIILGVFPLLLSALENYRESAEVLGDWWKFKAKYKKCKRDIEFHQITFTANLEELLLPLIVEDDELDDLLTDPGGIHWADSVLESRLRERLPNSYDSYLDSIHEIVRVMEELKKELGLENIHLQARIASDDFLKITKSRISRESLGYQGQRIKFALGQSNRQKHFDDFAKYNGRLRELLQTGDRISAIKRNNDSPKMDAVLSNFWRHAKTLYTVLSTSWCCQCRSSHHANLLLQHRTGPEIDFSVLLLFARDLMKLSGGLQWTSQQAHLKPVQEKQSHRVASTPSTPCPSIPKPKTSSSARPSILSRPQLENMSKSMLNLDLLSRRSSAKRSVGVRWTDSMSTLVGTELEDPMPEKQTVSIKDLCSSLSKGLPPDSILESGIPEDSSYEIQMSTSHDSVCDTVSLEEMLCRDFKYSFPRRKRYQVALILASSQIQLHSSQWLYSWSKADIVFPKQGSAGIAFHQPYISRDFSPEEKPSGEFSDGPGDQSVAILGILLLELCFGTALKDHPIRSKYPVMNGPQNFYLDLAAALEWSGQVNDEAGAGFASAVAWCLARHGAPTTDEKWRTELYANVVKPLQECNQHLG